MNNGKICVSVAAKTADEMIKDIRRAEPIADIVEVRFDYLRAGQIDDLKFQISDLKFETPLIATYRSPDEGGENPLTLAERKAFWQQPIPGFWAADVEEDVVYNAGEWPFCIVSFHRLNGLPTDIDGAFDRLHRCDADAIKMAVQVEGITDTIAVWKLLEKAKSLGKIIPIAMGEAGKWTRILGPAHGAFLTYASLDAGSETAAGQITATDLIDLYRVRALDEQTAVYGVIGDPVSESLSPHLHNPAFAAAGINSVFVPLLVKDLDAFMTRMVKPETREVELNFAGFAVTMPHKQAIMRHLDEIDPVAEMIGAVNTVKIDSDGKLIGYNTDAHGFLSALKQAGCEVKRNKVAVIGAGGAARACVYALGLEGAAVHMFARDVQNASSFASRFGALTSTISNLRSEISNFDVLVNATPLGMKGEFENDSPLTAEELKSVKLVFDLVTSSNDTPLIRDAKLAGIPSITGVEMLIEQGAKQFEIWTGSKAPLKLMRASVLAKIKSDER